jgi:basic amino acid/polyamine antiporter, APA family
VRELKAVLGARDLATLTLGTVIGSGIFLVPGVVLKQVGGSVALTVAVWVIGGALSLLGALTYAELGVSHPTSGGLYVHLRAVFGERIAFLFGWSMFLIMGSGTIAALAVAFATYLEEFLPLSNVGRRCTSVILIAVVAASNVLGARSSMNALTVVTGLKVAGILCLSLTLYWLGDAYGDLTSSWSHVTTSGVGVAMVGVLWAFQGWQWVLFSTGEVYAPQRTVPRGLVLGVLGVTVLYVLANGAYLVALGPQRMAQSTRIGADALGAVHQPLFAKMVAVLIMISIASAANGVLLTTSRLYYAMARDGLFFRTMAALSPSRGVPDRAVVASAVWAAVLALSGTFEQLLSYVIAFGWAFYALGAACVFGYRRERREPPHSFRVPGYPITPAVFIAATVLLVIDAVVRQPREALIGLAALFLGALVYPLCRASSASKAPSMLSRGGGRMEGPGGTNGPDC